MMDDGIYMGSKLRFLYVSLSLDFSLTHLSFFQAPVIGSSWYIVGANYTYSSVLCLQSGASRVKRPNVVH